MPPRVRLWIRPVYSKKRRFYIAALGAHRFTYVCVHVAIISHNKLHFARNAHKILGYCTENGPERFREVIKWTDDLKESR